MIENLTLLYSFFRSTFSSCCASQCVCVLYFVSMIVLCVMLRRNRRKTCSLKLELKRMNATTLLHTHTVCVCVPCSRQQAASSKRGEVAMCLKSNGFSFHFFLCLFCICYALCTLCNVTVLCFVPFSPACINVYAKCVDKTKLSK